jgi:hypothetical protein
MFDVDMWALATPIRAGNGAVYQSLVVGQNGITGIQVSESGLIRVTRDSASTLLIHGMAWGEEATAPAEPEITSAAKKAVQALRGK